LNTTKSFTGVTPKVGLTYRLGATHSVYASVGGGVEAPAGNETDPASTFGQDTVYNINPLLDPVRSVTYEIGTRRVVISSVGPFAEWSYDVAAFLTDVTNEIVPYRGGRFYFTAAKAQRTGIEAGTSLRAKDGWLLQGAVTMMNARYKNYLVDSVHYDKTKAGRFANYSNNEVVGVPDLTFNAAVSYAPDVFNGLRVRAGVQHTSKYWIDDANTVRVPSAAVYRPDDGSLLRSWQRLRRAWIDHGQQSHRHALHRLGVSQPGRREHRAAGVRTGPAAAGAPLALLRAALTAAHCE
jgi:iron complex outermembrane receptor protein